MQLPRSQREEKHDNLCEELLRERAAVLGRAGTAVEDALAELTKLDNEIKTKREQLKSLKLREQCPQGLNEQQEGVEEINAKIDKFNAVRKKAQLQYYYLIVTREALGLRRHDMIREIYVIPIKKEKIQDF
ncbi:MAG: hypothetical protein CVU52_02900 [Deltaproteobacteria bacterium HGW-Deltaproteobacteria-10]|nr:MAG: hypothetical protein CVU52_02900 [Deltaproteobacteria bacterium HGW-Deltaproteobacteria-10]